MSLILLIPYHRLRRDLRTIMDGKHPVYADLSIVNLVHPLYISPSTVHVEACSTDDPLDVRTINVVPFAERRRSHHAQRFVPVLFPSGRQDPGKRMKQLCVSVRVHQDRPLSSRLHHA